MQLRASEFEVREIPKPGAQWAAARLFVAEHHYSGGCSNTCVYAHGLYRCGSGELLGVAMWLPPTKVAAQSVNKDDWRKVLSLTRLAIRADVPSNAATFLMARAIRLIRQDGRFVSLVTYADEFMRHTGAIYRAANWTYIGEMAAQPRWEDGEGRQVAKQATRTRTNSEMIALGHRMVGSFKKHKFVMHLKIQRQGDRRPIRLSNDNAFAWFAIAV
ncbi:hypothetical protein [Sphingomonas sp. TREG-RG-20F-R18-01]|uniref:Mom family adenine methylcarbamoylation protein n=1 Tax=Sphingomonas sp. TREG-RG-20F-R18-01 TaxID=2914982 RepID=UPI001F57FD2B|nr:hypothetical protein [Sphingomonas sp. TREG-RG-20F-R18-01]